METCTKTEKKSSIQSKKYFGYKMVRPSKIEHSQPVKSGVRCVSLLISVGCREI